MVDDIAAYNIRRWRALGELDALWTQPWFELDPQEARERVDGRGLLGDLAGKDVLLVASGGGQQSAAFAMLGARVTSADLSDDQLARDRAAAAHHGLEIETLQADMRDLSALPSATFDLVWQGYSINFVPDVERVFAQIARVIRPGGLYQVQCANPFSFGVTERDWEGTGYVLRNQYVDGPVAIDEDPDWAYERGDAGRDVSIPPAREYRHTLATVVNGLARNGFVIEHLADQQRRYPPDPTAEPGTWMHFISRCPPWLTFWTRYRPDML